MVPEQLHLYAITIGVEPSSPSSKWLDAKNRAEDLLRQAEERGLLFGYPKLKRSA